MYSFPEAGNPLISKKILAASFVGPRVFVPFPLIARALMHDSTARQQETDHKVTGLVSDPCKAVVFR
jgi:hypothetical protein